MSEDLNKLDDGNLEKFNKTIGVLKNSLKITLKIIILKFGRY